MATEIGKQVKVYDRPGEAREDDVAFAIRVRRKLAASLLKDLHQEPVRSITPGTVFGEWLRSIQVKTHLTKKDLAAALDTSPEAIVDMRADEFLPWTIPARQMTEVLCLFRLHLEGLNEFVVNSLQRSRNGRGDRLPSSSIVPLEISGWLSEVRAELTSRNQPELLN
jgi:hypothetical protein